jgi:hypothetical protein
VNPDDLLPRFAVGATLRRAHHPTPHAERLRWTQPFTRLLISRSASGRNRERYRPTTASSDRREWPARTLKTRPPGSDPLNGSTATTSCPSSVRMAAAFRSISLRRASFRSRPVSTPPPSAARRADGAPLVSYGPASSRPPAGRRDESPTTDLARDRRISGWAICRASACVDRRSVSVPPIARGASLTVVAPGAIRARPERAERTQGLRLATTGTDEPAGHRSLGHRPMGALSPTQPTMPDGPIYVQVGEGPVGFEPTTRGLKVPCSAAELRARKRPYHVEIGLSQARSTCPPRRHRSHLGRHNQRSHPERPVEASAGWLPGHSRDALVG